MHPRADTKFFFEAIGTNQAYAFNYDPAGSLRFAKMVCISNFQTVTSNKLDREMRSVGVRNNDPEFDCQQWSFAWRHSLRGGVQFHINTTGAL